MQVNASIRENCIMRFMGYSFKAVIMVQLTTEQRVFVVKHWFITRSYDEVRRLFRDHFPDREPPTKKTIWTNVNKYSEHATSLNRNSGHSGRPKTSRS